MYVYFNNAQQNLSTREDWYRFFNYVKEHPEDNDAYRILTEIVGDSGPLYRNFYEPWLRENELLEQAEKSGDWTTFYRDMNNAGFEISPNIEKYVDANIARQNTDAAYQHEESMRDTSLLSSASQLQQLGLSPSNVISVGGASAPAAQAAETPMSSVSMNRQRLAMQKYQTRMSMAKGILGMVSSMASSGIYGTALKGARKAASALTSSTAHSGLKALQSLNTKSSGTFGQDPAFMKQWNSLPSNADPNNGLPF